MSTTAEREMLENAARANGMEVLPDTRWERDAKGWFYNNAGGDGGMYERTHHVPKWNPLTNSGDALELAVKLRIHIEHFASHNGVNVGVQASPKGAGHLACVEPCGDDPLAATRLAITRAAASIQLAKPATHPGDRHE